MDFNTIKTIINDIIALVNNFIAKLNNFVDGFKPDFGFVIPEA